MRSGSDANRGALQVTTVPVPSPPSGEQVGPRPQAYAYYAFPFLGARLPAGLEGGGRGGVGEKSSTNESFPIVKPHCLGKTIYPIYIYK